MRTTSSRLSLPRELTENWTTLALVLIFLLAMSIRMIPTQHGSILDPDAFFMYRMARDVVEKGYYPTWDNLGWQPEGRSLEAEMPLLPFSIAFSYMLLKFLGSNISLNSWTIIFPAIVGATSVFPVYLMGRELRGKSTGLIAALLIATMPEFLNRTIGGVTDKECLAFPIMLSAFALMFMVLKEENSRRGLLQALVAGLLFGLVALTWGGFTYLLLLLTAFQGLVILLDITGLRSSSDELLLFLTIMSATMLAVAMGIPNWGPKNPFTIIHILTTLGLLFYLVLTRVIVKMGVLARRTSLIIFVLLVVIIGLFPIYGSSLGIINFKINRKFLILLNPFETPEVGMHGTVQEYAKPTTADWLSRYSFYSFLAIAGAYFALRRRTSLDLLVLLWAASGFFAGLSAIRSTMLLTPPLCLLGAIATKEFMDILSRDRSLSSLLSAGARGVAKDINNELRLAKFAPALSAGLLIMLLLPSIFFGVQLAQGRSPVLGQGWYDALMWLYKETPEDSILVSWWDYGHWITSIAERRCVSDGATTDFNVIQATAHAYLSPEDVSIETFKDWGVEYVIVPEHDFWLVGAFAQIVGNITDFPEGYYQFNQETGSVSWTDLTDKAQNTTIYKLLFSQPDSTEKNFELIHTSPGSQASRDTTVRIYKVNY